MAADDVKAVFGYPTLVAAGGHAWRDVDAAGGRAWRDVDAAGPRVAGRRQVGVVRLGPG
ncbi:hypothetical protein [Micromonospora musae]|uniref:hypothetical protein n=1 Tax=Micromonospora musae TaxID=1894970 RepID=UPI0013151A2F|nr:hypothetical protein [Micromonospora musae]